MTGCFKIKAFAEIVSSSTIDLFFDVSRLVLSFKSFSLKKFILLSSKDALNLSKLTLKT